MKYTVFTTEKAEGDLKEILKYLAYTLKAGETAIKQIERIESAILSLDEMPERFRIYDEEPWRTRKLRVMSVDNYLVFYIAKKEEKSVTVLRVMYGRRDISTRLKDENK